MGTTFKFSELRKLHAQGLTLLWLYPRAKEPAGGAGWTKAPRIDFDSFKAKYRPGYNVGVRLGEISKMENGYLAVLDLDVKGLEKRHREEAEAKLAELFPDTKLAPFVHSGRGNGSAHYYVLTEKPRRGGETQAKSSEIVKVKMPSVGPSKRELDQLTPEELKAGLRLRPAWEISLLSEGRQVVLPGSVHPDSGRRYEWGRSDLTKIARIAPRSGESAALNQSAVHGAQPHGALPKIDFREVSVESLGLRPDQIASIKVGAGVTDRSGAVFALSMAMLQRGVSERDILSVFTDQSNYLGQTAFDHAKTSSREVAARWLQKYTLPRAKAQTVESAFEVEIKLEEDVVQGKIADQPSGVTAISGAGASAFSEAGEWKKELDMQPGPKGSMPTLRATFKNLRLILSNTIGEDFLQFDEFSMKEFWASDVPWGIDAQTQRSAGTQDEIKLKGWLIEEWGVEVSINMLTETLAWFSGQNHFHPVKDYLESLEWDGCPRIAHAFEAYLGVKMNRTYTRAVSKKFFLALIARIYEPGIKFDYLPVLEGKQGIGKSTFGRILVSDKWFMDGLPDLADKDAALNLTGIWLCEMSELSSLYRSQLEVAKAFIARQVDKVRPPYGARRIDLPRQSVFVGTTNDRDYLVDETGNRRYWPVEIEGCKFKELTRDREQLLAEAHWCYLTDMEPLYLQGKALAIAEQIQESRRVDDDFDTITFKISEWLKLPPSKRSIKDASQVRIDDLFDQGPLFGMQKTTTTRKKAATVMRKFGYKRVHSTSGRLWVRKS